MERGGEIGWREFGVILFPPSFLSNHPSSPLSSSLLPSPFSAYQACPTGVREYARYKFELSLSKGRQPGWRGIRRWGVARFLGIVLDS